MAELTLGQSLGEQELQTLLHLPGGLVGEGHRQDLGGIGTVFPNQMGNSVRECPGFAAARTGHHQQGPLMVINRPALGVIEAGEKAHEAMVRTLAFRSAAPGIQARARM